MKKASIIIIVLIFISSIKTFSNYPIHDVYPIQSEVNLIIQNNEINKMDSICRKISALPCEERNHNYEVMMLHKIIDDLNLDLLMILLSQKIGLHQRGDSISPWDYLMSKSIDEIIQHQKAKGMLSEKEINAKFGFTFYVLMFFYDEINKDDFSRIDQWLGKPTSTIPDSIPDFKIKLCR